LISAVFPNPDLLLRPGQYAKVFIKVKEIENAVVIPQRAVQQIQTNFQAAVVASNGEVTVRPIEVGQKTEDGGWVITSGIEAGENVIVEGLQHVKTGMKVKTAPYEASPSGASPTPTPQATPSPAPTPAS
jgi:multidrug efflux pump subunit AcrA (membrane-fusion protein)